MGTLISYSHRAGGEPVSAKAVLLRLGIFPTTKPLALHKCGSSANSAAYCAVLICMGLSPTFPAFKAGVLFELTEICMNGA